MITWYEVYADLVKQLYAFGKNNDRTPGMVLYSRCLQEKEFKTTHKWFRKLEVSKDVAEIDPAHIFGSFNEEGLSYDLRIKKINSWFWALSSETAYNEIDFTGCPVADDSVKLLLSRRKTDSSYLWTLFIRLNESKPLRLTDDEFNADSVRKTFSFFSFTTYLFWIDPDNFLSLDKDTIRFLMFARLLNNRFKLNASRYNNLMKQVRSAISYRDLVKTAQENSKGSPEFQPILDALALMGYGAGSLYPPKPTSIDFKVIGMRFLDGINEAYLKVLSKNEYYVFYDAYVFKEDGTISYDPSRDVKLYSSSKLDINISAIVGKNGSGKSTINELLYMALNDFAFHKVSGGDELLGIGDLYMELYFRTSDIYKLEIKGSSVKIFEYSSGKNDPTGKDTFIFRPGDITSDFNPRDLFYTIAINYSHYGLNAAQVGPWISNLFHKNDGYQIPVTLTPFRKDGNIDINSENELLMSRLIVNILEPVTEESTGSTLRQLTDNERSASELKFLRNKHKIDKINRKSRARGMKKEYSLVLGHLLKRFTINQGTPLFLTATRYIHQKLVKIAGTYKEYEEYIDKKTKRLKPEKISGFLNKIETRPSHVTFKLNQAINFLVHEKLHSLKLDTFIDINLISDGIEFIKRNTKKKREIKTVELVPPSFLMAEIKLSDNSDFKDLSSGEKQRIYAVSSLVYHLNNINSVNPSSKLISYNYVNVVFDEVELYFHPDMQRKFIKYMLDYIDKIRFSRIYGINFCFVTHSPFILSDIPTDNILFLQKDKEEREKLKKLSTFGANIHELLVNGFFMENTIGDFALAKINELLGFYEKVQNTQTEHDLASLKNQYQPLKNKFYFVRDNLGEKYISNILANHIEKMEEKLGEKEFLNKEIRNLEKELEVLKLKRNAEN